MKTLFAIKQCSAYFCIILIFFLFGCKSQEENKKNIFNSNELVAYLYNNLEFKPCEGTVISNNMNNDSSLELSLYLIQFPSEKCLKDFFDSAESSSAFFENVDGKSYSRSIGSFENDQKHFIISRSGKKEVSFALRR